ncbi:hypothetical protein BDZ45DRAFT_680838 [Acephala macrosclerotiorum]|nr:hypothetical protein BDZ45DRAFT_680838 [Acephala macrosclerotiorum]
MAIILVMRTNPRPFNSRYCVFIARKLLGSYVIIDLALGVDVLWNTHTCCQFPENEGESS